MLLDILLGTLIFGLLMMLPVVILIRTDGDIVGRRQDHIRNSHEAVDRYIAEGFFINF